MLRARALPFLGLLAAWALMSREAGAVTALAADGSAVRLARAEVVSALGSAPTTSWIELGFSGAGRVALVVELPRDGVIDAAGARLIDALEQTTAPRVVPPRERGTCAASVESTARAPIESRVDPELVARFDDGATTVAALDAHGLALAPELEAELVRSPAPHAIVRWSLAGGESVTSALRVRAPLAPGLASLRLGASPAELTFVAFADRPVALGGVNLRAANDLGVTWFGARRSSDYRVRRDVLLDGARGAVWVSELDSATALTDWTLLDGSAALAAPLVDSYLQGAPGECHAALMATVRAGGVAGAACSAGTLLGAAPGAAPCREPSDAEVTATQLRCAERDDLAFALAGLDVARVRIARFSGRSFDRAPVPAPGIGDTPSGVAAPLVRARFMDAQGCGSSGAGGSGGFGGAGGSSFGGSGGDAGQGAESGSAGDDGWVEEPRPSYRSNGEFSCYSSSNSSCSGDSSSSSSDDSCGGDSSSSSSDGDTCSGDSSSSSSSDGDSCSGSSGSSASDGDSCGGSSSGSDSSCSGSSGSSSDCSVSRRRGPPLKASALVMALSVLAWGLRRATGPRRPRFAKSFRGVA